MVEPSVSLTVRTSNDKDRISGWGVTYIVHTTAGHPLKGGHVERRLTHRVTDPFRDDRSPRVVALESAESSHWKRDSSIQSQNLAHLLFDCFGVAIEQEGVVLSQGDQLVPNLCVIVGESDIFAIGSKLNGEFEGKGI